MADGQFLQSLNPLYDPEHLSLKIQSVEFDINVPKVNKTSKI